MSNGHPDCERLVLGPLQTNCYLLICPTTHAALLIDPADEPDRILKVAQDRGARIEQILLTHVHPDHLAAVPAVRKATGAPLLVHRLDAALLQQYGPAFGLSQDDISDLIPDIQLEGGEELSIGQLTAKVIHTPGHTPGGVTLRIGDLLFTGDTLFAQGVGRVDLPGGNREQLSRSLHLLLALPEECAVYPGHGPSSTIDAEKRDNPYIF